MTGGDARYRKLAESYANLSRDFENLKSQYSRSLLVYEDACTEMKQLKKMVLGLQSLVSILFMLLFFCKHITESQASCLKVYMLGCLVQTFFCYLCHVWA